MGVALASVLVATSCDGGDGGGSGTGVTAPDPPDSVVDVPTVTEAPPPPPDGPIARLVRRQVEGSELPPGVRYRRFDELIDATGGISIEVPASWIDRDVGPHLIGSAEEPFIEASPDRDGFRSSFAVPGIQFSTLSTSTTVDSALAGFGFSEQCDDRGERPFESRAFTGMLQVWHGCDDTDASIVLVAANRNESTVTTLILAQVVTRADLVALDRAVATFRILEN